MSDDVYDCIVDVEGIGVVPFSATSFDSEPHGIKLFNEIVFGTHGVIPDYVPPVKPLAELKRDVLIESEDTFESMVRTHVEGYSKTEITSWDRQEKEARAWKADNAAITPLIDSITSARGMDKDAFCDKVIVNADNFSAIVGDLLGQKQRIEDQVKVATDNAAVEAVPIEFYKKLV